MHFQLQKFVNKQSEFIGVEQNQMVLQLGTGRKWYGRDKCSEREEERKFQEVNPVAEKLNKIMALSESETSLQGK